MHKILRWSFEWYRQVSFSLKCGLVSKKHIQLYHTTVEFLPFILWKSLIFKKLSGITVTKQNLWASAIYWTCQVCSYNDKEAAKTEHTLAQLMLQFYVKHEINLMKIELEIKPVILRLSRKERNSLACILFREF